MDDLIIPKHALEQMQRDNLTEDDVYSGSKARLLLATMTSSYNEKIGERCTAAF